jgi:hypothetical protein
MRVLSADRGRSGASYTRRRMGVSWSDVWPRDQLRMRKVDHSKSVPTPDYTGQEKSE